MVKSVDNVLETTLETRENLIWKVKPFSTIALALKKELSTT